LRSPSPSPQATPVALLGYWRSATRSRLSRDHHNPGSSSSHQTSVMGPAANARVAGVCAYAAEKVDEDDKLCASRVLCDPDAGP
jgi:hypothetical protein